MKINNLPANPLKYIIAMDIEGELWYYGSDNDEQKAYRVASKVSRDRNVPTIVSENK